jgi:polar amino acid transport system substrate-binding protein
MPSQTGLFFCCLVLASLLVGPAIAATANEPLKPSVIRIATGNWQPYVDTAKPDFGPMGQVIATAFERSGYQVTYDSYPWTRNTQVVAKGEYDAMMPYYCSEDRAKRFLCSDAIVEGEQVLFHRADMALQWSIVDDLKGYGIGATLGYFYGEAFAKAEESGDLKVKRVAQDESNLRLLMRGRIDLYPQDRAVGYGMIRTIFEKEDWERLTHHPKPLHTNPLHVLFSRATGRGERLLEIFNAELETMRHSGKLEKLLTPLYADERAVSGDQ